MRRTTNKKYLTLDGYTFPICMVTDGACFIGMLDKAKQQLDAMLSHYSRVYVVSFTVHSQIDTSKNDAMSALMRRFRKVVQSKRYRFNRFAYAWFREASNGERGKHHYHLMLMMDGHKVRNATGLLHDVLCPNAEPLGLRVFLPKGCQSSMLTRHDSALYDDCLYQLSYFSKVVGKGCKAPSSNNYSTSRIKPNNDQVWAGFKDATGQRSLPI